MASTFILLHGTPGDTRQMRPLAEKLEPHGRVILFDLPDHGAAADDLSLDPDDQVAHVRGRIEALGPDPVTLVGLSWGGWMIARLGAAPPPNLVRAVSIGGLSALPAEVAAQRIELANAVQQGALSRSELAEIAVQLFVPGHRAHRVADETRELILSYPADRLDRSLRRSAGVGRPDRAAGRYDIPTTLLHARHDAAVPLALGEELAALGSRSELVVLETDSHLLPVTNTADCVAAILRD